MSGNSAPPRRSLSTSLTRLDTSALVDFMLAHLAVDPCGMPVMQAGVVDGRRLLHVLVRSEVGAPLEDQAQAVGEGQAADLGVASCRRHRLLARGDQLLDGALVDRRVRPGHEV